MSVGAISFNNIISTRITGNGGALRSNSIAPIPSATNHNSSNSSNSNADNQDNRGFFSPMLIKYQMMVEFSDVKYLPSNAGKPDESLKAANSYNKTAESKASKPYYRVEAVI